MQKHDQRLSKLEQKSAPKTAQQIKVLKLWPDGRYTDEDGQPYDKPADDGDSTIQYIVIQYIDDWRRLGEA